MSLSKSWKHSTNEESSSWSATTVEPGNEATDASFQIGLGFIWSSCAQDGHPRPRCSAGQKSLSNRFTSRQLWLTRCTCEHCANWIESKKPEICRECYWAYPDSYSHVAMREARRTDLLWTGPEVASYERLKRRTLRLQKNIPGYVKEIIESHLATQPEPPA